MSLVFKIFYQSIKNKNSNENIFVQNINLVIYIKIDIKINL